MSIHFTSGQFLNHQKPGNIVTFAGPYSAMAWFRSSVMDGSVLYLASGNALEFDRVYVNSTNSVIQLRGSNTTINADVIDVTPFVLNRWYFVAMVRTSNTLIELFVGTTPATIVSKGTLSTDQSSRGAITRVQIGASGSGAPFLVGDVVGPKVVEAALTLAELKLEAAQLSPVTANQATWWPFDQIGSGYVGNPAYAVSWDPTGPPTTSPDNPPDLMWELNRPGYGAPIYTRRPRIVIPHRRAA